MMVLKLHDRYNPKARVLVTRRLPACVEARAACLFHTLLNPTDRPYHTASFISAAEGCDALLVCPTDAITAAVIERLSPRVRAIATFSVGYDHIDLGAAQHRGILVTNTPDVVTESTADVTLLVLLAAARRASEGERMVREGCWQGWTPTQLLGTHVSGKRLGIVGMGRIGRAVAQRARGFGMTVLYHNRTRLALENEQGAVYYPCLEEMLPQCDILTLHCPLTPQTRHLLNAPRLALLPPGALVVNTARGGLIDDEALIAALSAGHIRAAGLDVFADEPHVHPAYRRLVESTFVLPHLGTATQETRIAMGMRALENLEAIFTGCEPRDRVA